MKKYASTHCNIKMEGKIRMIARYRVAAHLNLGCFLCAILSLVSLTGPAPAARPEKVHVVFTGGLGDLAHPIGKNQGEFDARFKRLDRILTSLKKKYPAALFVDTGNFLNLPDSNETLYGAPGYALLRKHGFAALNAGSRELALGHHFINLFRGPDAEESPPIVAGFRNTSDSRPISNLFTDIPLKTPDARVRITGLARLDHAVSAPGLKERIQPVEGIHPFLDNKKEGPMLFLSDLSPAEARAFAGEWPSEHPAIILGRAAASESANIENAGSVWIVHRTDPYAVGHLEFVWKAGAILSMEYREHAPVRRIGFFRRLFGVGKEDKLPLLPEKEFLPLLGQMDEKDRLIKKIRTPHDHFEINRFRVQNAPIPLKSPDIYCYELYQGATLVGKSFLINHFLGPGRPQFFAWITLSPDHRLLDVSPVTPTFVGSWEAFFYEKILGYKGMKLDEIPLEFKGCAGAEDIYHILHADVTALSQIMESDID